MMSIKFAEDLERPQLYAAQHCPLHEVHGWIFLSIQKARYSCHGFRDHESQTARPIRFIVRWQ